MPKKTAALIRIGQFLEYTLVRAMTLGLAPLSAGQVQRIGRLLGDAAYRMAVKRRQMALTNLDLAFGDSKTAREKHAIVRASFRQLATSALECLWASHDPGQRVPMLIEGPPDGLSDLKRCLERGKGVFFLTAHYGNWEIMGLNHGLLGLAPLHSIARKLDNPWIERRAMAFRTVTGNAIFHREDSPLKIVRALKRNDCVAVMMDQNTALGGVFVDFFGRAAATPRSLALLSHRIEAAILPLFCHPTGKGTYRIQYGPELVLEKSGNREADILNGTQACCRFIESVIRQRPDFWMWGHRRWKTRPPGEPGIY